MTELFKKNSLKQIWFKTQQECFDYYVGQTGTTDYLNEPLHTFFYIARDLCKEAYKEYTAFENCKHYIKWLKTQQKKNCYEIIRFERCEYYDIDVKPSSPYFKYGSTGVLDLFFDLYEKWILSTDYPHSKLLNMRHRFAYILQSENPSSKISFHILFRHGFLLPNKQQNKLYADCFFNFIKENGHSDFVGERGIDDGVYTNNRNMRNINCSKYGEDRKLERSNYNEISQTCNEELFFISNIYPELIQIHSMCLENEIGYLHVSEGLNFINTKEKDVKYDKEFDGEECKISPEESKIMFDNLNIKRWDDFTTCRNLIWLGKKMNLSDKDIHLYCQKSSKYNKKWVQKLINDAQEDSPLKLGTLLWYLRKDVDSVTFNNIRPKSLKYSDIIKKERPEWTEAETIFINKIYEKIDKQNLDKLTIPTCINPMLRSDDFVTSDIYIASSKKINIIKAGLGRGKSQSVSDYIKKSKYGSIIVLTPRRSYAKSAKERLIKETGLPFICYLEQKKSLIEKNYVVIQAESLYRLDLTTQENMLLIVDEVEAFLYQLTSTITHKENHIKNVETFIELVKQSQKCIALDAFISDRTLQTFKTLCGLPHIDFFQFTKQIKQRKAIEIDNIDIFINSIITICYQYPISIISRR
jgi:hypothetical protein